MTVRATNAVVTLADLAKLSKCFVRLRVLRSRPIDMLAAMFVGNRAPQAVIRTKWTQQEHGPFRVRS